MSSIKCETVAIPTQPPEVNNYRKSYYYYDRNSLAEIIASSQIVYRVAHARTFEQHKSS